MRLNQQTHEAFALRILGSLQDIKLNKSANPRSRNHSRVCWESGRLRRCECRGGHRWFGRSIPQHVSSTRDAHALDHRRHAARRGTDGMAAAPSSGRRGCRERRRRRRRHLVAAREWVTWSSASSLCFSVAQTGPTCRPLENV
jgi:hypothetical protein